MKIPLFSKLVAAKPRGRKVVRASAARAMRAEEEDFYESEPNMKLSHAFMVVLVLHVVAVGGIYAFNKVSANKNANLVSDISGHLARATGGTAAPAAAKPEAPAQKLPGDADEPLPSVQAAGPMVSTAPPVPAAAPKADAKPAAPTPAAASAKTEPKPAAKAEAPKVAATKAPADAKAGAATYKVAKGDSPYTIAKKLNVSQEELLSINGISDPKKLQIGQVLKVPGKSH